MSQCWWCRGATNSADAVGFERCDWCGRRWPPTTPLADLQGATERMEKAAQPSPAEMLDEALEHVTKALDLLDKAGPAGEYLSFVSVVVKGNRFHDALAELKREAEAREAPNGR